MSVGVLFKMSSVYPTISLSVKVSEMINSATAKTYDRRCVPNQHYRKR